MNQEYNNLNSASRQRLCQTVERLSDAQLSTPMSNDWTPAAYLAHVAFFDRRALELARRFTSASEVRESPIDLHVTNDALLPQWRLIDPRAAANEAVAAAEATDAAIANLAPGIVERIQALDAFALNRAKHRDLHLDEIEELFV
jgi:hypothetical protein